VIQATQSLGMAASIFNKKACAELDSVAQ